jgi:hypothetical protein
LLGIVGAAVVALLLIEAVPLLRVLRDDPKGRCAAAAPDRTADLEGARWTWIPPGWICEYEPSGRRVRVP